MDEYKKVDPVYEDLVELNGTSGAFLICDRELIGVHKIPDLNAYRLRIWIEIVDKSKYQCKLESYIDSIVAKVSNASPETRVLCFVFWNFANTGHTASDKRMFNMDVDVIKYFARMQSRPMSGIDFDSLPYQNDILRIY